MVKRILSSQASDFLSMSKLELKQAILASEGRTIMAENIPVFTPMFQPCSNAEVEKAAGADMILFNGLDCFEPVIQGVPKDITINPVHWIKESLGRPIGINLEPVDESAKVMDVKENISAGRQATIATFKQANELKFDFVCLTGNPSTGVTNDTILTAIHQAKENFNGLVIAGKMHSAGIDEPVMNLEIAKMFVSAGVDILLVPAPYTVPFFREDDLYEIAQMVRAYNQDKTIEEKVLILAANGTSQDSSDAETIKKIGLSAKAAGADLHHIGDSMSGIALPWNIFALGQAIRGIRHQIIMMSKSNKR